MLAAAINTVSAVAWCWDVEPLAVQGEDNHGLCLCEHND